MVFLTNSVSIVDDSCNCFNKYICSYEILEESQPIIFSRVPFVIVLTLCGYIIGKIIPCPASNLWPISPDSVLTTNSPPSYSLFKLIENP